jgi:hypothetical protein
MKETIVDIMKSKVKNKKYTAIVKDKKSKQERKIHFGDNRYEQYKDTAEGVYSSKNHLDKKRRENYFNRHSGVKTKSEALKKEKSKSGEMYNAKILSHKYLW